MLKISSYTVCITHMHNSFVLFSYEDLRELRWWFGDERMQSVQRQWEAVLCYRRGQTPRVRFCNLRTRHSSTQRRLASRASRIPNRWAIWSDCRMPSSHRNSRSSSCSTRSAVWLLCDSNGITSDSTSMTTIPVHYIKLSWIKYFVLNMNIQYFIHTCIIIEGAVSADSCSSRCLQVSWRREASRTSCGCGIQAARSANSIRWWRRGPNRFIRVRWSARLQVLSLAGSSRTREALDCLSMMKYIIDLSSTWVQRSIVPV